MVKNALNPLPFDAPTLDAEDYSKERIDTKHIYTKIVNDYNSAEHTQRIKNYMAIEEEYNSSPPFDPKQLEEAGRSGESNFSTRLCESEVDEAIARRSRLFQNLTRFVSLPLRSELTRTIDRTEVLQSLLEEIFNDCLNRWEEREYEEIMTISDSVKYGPALMMRCLDDWRDKHVPIQNIVLSSSAASLESEWDSVGIIDCIPADIAVRVIEESEKSSKHGWNPAAMANALRYWLALPEDVMLRSWNDVLTMTQKYRSGEYGPKNSKSFWGYQIPIVRVFIKEFVEGAAEGYYVTQQEHDAGVTGKYRSIPGAPKGMISEYVFSYDVNVNNGSEVYLYRRRFAHRSMDEIFTAFPYTRSRYFWGTKGLGARIADFCTRHSILTSRMFDAAIDSMMKKIVAATEEDFDSLEEVIHTGDNVIYPPNTKFIENQTSDRNINASRALARDTIETIAVNNASESKGSVSPYETAQGARIRDRNERERRSLYEMFFIDCMDRRVRRLFKNFRDSLMARVKGSSWQRLSAKAIEILDYCIDQMNRYQIPEDAFAWVDDRLVTTTGKLGRGSPEDRLQAMSILERDVVAMSPEKQEEWRRERFAAVLGAKAANYWLPDNKPATQNELDNVWFATMENGTLMDGVPVTARANDLDIIHINIHTAAIQMIETRIETQRISIMDSVIALAEIYRHLYEPGQHISRYLSNLPQDKEFIKSEIRRITLQKDQLINRIAELSNIAQQQQGAQQMNPLQQAQMQRALAQVNEINTRSQLRMEQVAIQRMKAQAEIDRATTQQ